MKFKTACVQLSSGKDIAENVEKISMFVSRAASYDADFITLPENCFFMDGNGENFPSSIFENGKHPGIIAVKNLAEKFSKYILIGSVSIKSPENGKAFNRSILVSPEGKIVAEYNKVHLFDAEPEGDRKYTESEKITAGDKFVTVQLPWGVLGMSVCYDVRFPYMYREMAIKHGATMFTIPAAFTVPTGKAHWHVLTRARAIENGAYVIAPAQYGEHPGGRKTYGNSLIINPWGEIIAELHQDEGVIVADVDATEVAKARAAIPSLKNGREDLA